jgi:hypothetical protein
VLAKENSQHGGGRPKLKKCRSKKDKEGNVIDGYYVFFKKEKGWLKRSQWV